MKYIDKIMKKLGYKHTLHVSVYGDGNLKRLTGHHETSGCDVLSYGIANRATPSESPLSLPMKKERDTLEIEDLPPT